MRTCRRTAFCTGPLAAVCWMFSAAEAASRFEAPRAVRINDAQTQTSPRFCVTSKHVQPRKSQKKKIAITDAILRGMDYGA